MNIYGMRYVEAAKFAEYFHKTAGPVRDHFSESSYLQELEFWEKEKVFWPYFRLVLPRKYVSTIFKIKHSNSAKKVLPERWQQQWKDLYLFLERYNRWPWSDSKEAIHPFDSNLEFPEFFKRPKDSPFRAWKTFTFSIQREDYSKQLIRAHHYYHYWQIHLLDAIRRENTIIVIGNFDWSRVRKSWAKGAFPPKRQRISMSFGYYVGSSKLRKIEDRYDILSQYIQVSRREFGMYAAKYAVEEGGRKIIQQKAYDEFLAKCKRYAIQLVSTSGISETEWFEFLRILCDLYVEYDLNGRALLAEELKKDIDYLIELIVDVYSADIDSINRRVGHSVYGGSKKSLLETVFPDPLKDAKEHSIWFIESRLSDYNAKVSLDHRLEKDDVTNLCDYLSEKELSLVFQSHIELDQEWAKRSPFYKNNSFSYLRNIAVSIESFIKVIGAESSESAIASKFLVGFSGRQTFGNVVEWMFDRATWWNAFSRAVKKFPSANPDELTGQASQILNGCFHDDSSCDFIIKNFILTKLVRDYTMHQAVFHEHFYRYHYIDAINAMTYTLLFIWANASPDKLLDAQNRENWQT